MNNLKTPDSRTCTTCLETLPLDKFYSKGNRLDSSCKECKKAKSKTTYKARKKPNYAINIVKFIDLACELETKRLKLIEKKLEQIIRRHDECGN